MDTNSTPSPSTFFRYAKVPLEWVKSAGELGFKDMRLTSYLWFEHGVNQSGQFPASPDKARKLTGISQKQFQRGIRQLNKANLLLATPRSGSRTLVQMAIPAILKKGDE